MPPTQGHDFTAAASPTALPPSTRTIEQLLAQMRAIRDDNAFAIINPVKETCPNGQGNFEFLDHIDATTAASLGHSTAADVAEARKPGALVPDLLDIRGPHVLWMPDSRFMIPGAEPLVAGHWEFYTPAAAHRAAVDFANQYGFGTHGIDSPTAAHVLRIREEYENVLAEGHLHGLSNRAAAIDVVWIPDDAPVEDSAGDAATETKPSDSDVHTGHGIDTHTGLRHIPNSGGANDQTALPTRRSHYQTPQFGDRIVTLDRYPAKTGVVEPHKLWVFDGDKWHQWFHAADMNWTDEKKIGKINKWREQVCSRAGWPKKREQPQRENYTAEERKYFFDMIVESEGLTPKMKYRALTEEFNKRFGYTGEAERTIGAIQSLIHKLVKEYEKFGGKQRPRREKGRQAKKNLPEQRAPNYDEVAVVSAAASLVQSNATEPQTGGDSEQVAMEIQTGKNGDDELDGNDVDMHD